MARALFQKPMGVLDVLGEIDSVALEPLRFTNIGDEPVEVSYWRSPLDSSAARPHFEVSRNGGAYSDWDYSPITLNAGDYLLMRGDNTRPCSSFNAHFYATGSGRLKLSGDIMSLISGDLFEDAFGELFRECALLADAHDLKLSATALATRCYQGMFNSCHDLVQAPQLPAPNLVEDCYSAMFKDCTSLQQAPDLPATTLAAGCYATMFQGCTSLQQAPDLPVTTLANYCYSYMFADCTSLQQAPDLPATTLTWYCYNYMFSGCTSLLQAPDLPATALVDGCYASMFQGCTSLSSVKMYASSWLVGATSAWLNHVSGTGTFYCSRALEERRGTSYIPGGWNIVYID